MADVRKPSIEIDDRSRGPVSPPPATADDRPSERTLDQMVSILQSEIVDLRNENLRLKERFELVQRPARTPDDFARAVAHSVDCLQSRLGELSNPLTNFAVRELTLEASVTVDVTGLGTIDYHFVQPGDQVDAGSLSKLRLTLTPIPKEGGAGSFTRPDFTPAVAVEEIIGVGEIYRKKLNQHQIYTVGDLVAVGTRVRSQVELASLLEVDRIKLGEWLGQAELLTVRDLDGRAAEVLRGIGITGLRKLAETEPGDLVQRFNAAVAASGHKTRKPIAAAQAESWIRAARAWAGRQPVPPPTTPAPPATR